MLYSCKNKSQKLNVYYLNNTPKYIINKTLNSLEKIEVYPINETFYIRNDVIQDKWTSSICLVGFPEELPVSFGSNYVYDVKVIETNWHKGYFVLIFDSTHRGNGSCLIYSLNIENSSFSLIYDVKGIKVNGFLFNNKPLNVQIVDDMEDSMEIIFYGIKDNGQGATYDYKKKIKLNSRCIIVNESEEFKEDDYVFAILHHICNAEKSNQINDALIRILNFLNRNYEFKDNMLSNFSGIKFDVLKIILNKFDAKIKINNPNAILNIIDQHRIEYYGFIFDLLQNKDVLGKFGEKEKLFIENYDRYLRGIISSLDQI